MNCVSTVVAGCGQDYWRINCDVIKEEGTKYSKWDFHVPIENVTACVDRMLRNLSPPQQNKFTKFLSDYSKNINFALQINAYS